MAVPIVFVLASAIIIVTFMYLHFSTRHKERMALIESGRDAGIFNEKQTKRIGSNALKYGLFLVFIGGGVLAGIAIAEIFRVDEIVVLPSVLISGGLALLLYYKMMRREEEELESARRFSSTKGDAHELV